MKKVQKTLTGAMAAVMATGMATPVMAATTDVDAIYKAAYNATMKALETKTQAAVNEARTAIKALPATLEAAIGEFSKQVDTIQHPILVNIVKAITLAQTTPTQANVNAAKAAIPAELTATWKNSYSAAVDKVQQGLLDAAMTAVKLAEASRKVEDVEAAKVLVADLLTATSEGIKTAATTMGTRVDAVKIYDLDVTEVVEIDTVSVSVKFTALEKALTDATVEVKDNKGNVVEVRAEKELVKDETTATFTLAKSLTKRPEGIWTVNGVKFNLDIVNLIVDIDEKIDDTDKLFLVLDKSGLVKNLVDEVVSHTAYQKALTKAIEDGKLNTLEDVQKAINEANKTSISDDAIKAVVKIAADTNKTNRTFENAFLALGLTNVNEDWTREYREAIQAKTDVNKDADISKVSTQKALQDIVNAANKTKVNAVVAKTDVATGKALDAEAINDAISLVKKYHAEDVKPSTTKADILSGLNVKLAISKVNSAKTETSLKTALKGYYTAIGKDKDYAKKVNENILGAYLAAKDIVNDKTTLEAMLTDGYNAKLAANLSAIEVAAKKYVEDETSTLKAEFKTSLTNLAKTEELTKDFVTKDIKDDNLFGYATRINTQTLASTKLTVNNLNTIISDENGSTITTALGKVKTDKAEGLLDALKTLKTNNLVEENVPEYFKMLYTVSGSVATQVSGLTLSNIQNKIDAVNSFNNLLEAKDVETVSEELVNLAVNKDSGILSGYMNSIKNVTISDDIAELLLAGIESKDATVTNMSELDTEVTKLISVHQAIFTNMNGGAIDVEALRTALTKISPDFKDLTAKEQYTVVTELVSYIEETTKVNGVDVLVNKALKTFEEVRIVLEKL